MSDDVESGAEELQSSDPMQSLAPGPGAPREPEAPAAVVAHPPRRRRDRMVTEEAELTLGPFAPDGTTTAEFAGRTIPVEKGIPGERVRATVTTLKGRKGWTRATVTDVLEAAPERVEPLCPYFREHDCGGCEWQHIAYPEQLSTYKYDNIVPSLLADAGVMARPDGAQ